MNRVRLFALAFAASLFALTACLVTPPAPANNGSQPGNQQTGTTSQGLTAGGDAELRLTVEGEGYVNITPPSSNCGPTTICTYSFTPGTDLTIYTDAPAIPGSNHSFKEWGGDCASLGNNPYPNLTVNASMNCLARFTPEGR